MAQIMENKTRNRRKRRRRKRINLKLLGIMLIIISVSCICMAAVKKEDEPELIREGMNNFSEALKRMGAEASEAIREFGESLREYGKELNQAMKYTETENMLRRAHQMPEGVDKSLLKHIGIRTDRAGWVYDFWLDEANNEYFVELLQEGVSE